MQSRKSRLFRQLLATTLLLGGTFNLVAPVLAAGTAAGQTISNTATGTYEDSNTPGVPINATSNTVTLKVAEVAGIDITAVSTPVTANPGGNLTYDFRVTNTGNDVTTFVLPKNATLSGTGKDSGRVTSVIYSTDATFDNSDTTYTYDPAVSDDQKTFTTGAIGADQAVYVRVVVQLNNSATGGQNIQVEYGSTSNPAGTNQDYAANTTLDAYTKDAANGTLGEADGDPVNNRREDSATLNGSIGTVASLINGPGGQAGAVGADGSNQTDFSSKSTKVPANSTPGIPIDPEAVTFTNTINNTTNAPQPITIMPTTLTGGINLKPGTEVTITDPATQRSAKYTYTGGAFTSTVAPIVITIPQGGTANYTVTVDLPADTKLSTDLITPGDLNTAFGGYDVPIAAFVDAGTPNVIDPTDVQNITIDTAYVGLLAMYKDAKIIDDKGVLVQDFTTNPSSLDGKLRPGYFVEYRIQYKNISDASDASTNSKPSTAKNVFITEDGTTYNKDTNPTGNNWGLDNDGIGGIDTTHVSAVGKQVSEKTVGTNVTGYTDTVGDVAPQQSGQLLIRRKLN